MAESLSQSVRWIAQIIKNNNKQGWPVDNDTVSQKAEQNQKSMGL